MKKTYISPAIKTRRIMPTAILQGSITEDASGNISGSPSGNFENNSTVNSKQGFGWGLGNPEEN